jgi:hypothetical protein
MRRRGTATRWEMYLSCALLDEEARHGYTVEYPKPWPDVLLIAERRKVWGEAIIATNWQPGKPDSVSDQLLRSLGPDGELLA